MRDQLLVLVFGFVLTSVVGGGLGYKFQERSWRKRHEAELSEERHRQAIRTFEEMSTLLDRRIYRMRRVWWSIARSITLGAVSDDVKSARDDYREILFSWNDNLNRLLALIQTYFGTDAREALEDNIFEEFASIGRAIDYGLQRLTYSLDEPEPIPRVAHRLNALSRRVYEFNVELLHLLDADLLGNAASSHPFELHTDNTLIQFGAQGQQVRDLQRRLGKAGYSVDADGSFGAETYRALIAFQRTHGIAHDGVYGPRTRALLSSQAT
jgi:hypothetical protein